MVSDPVHFRAVPSNPALFQKCSNQGCLETHLEQALSSPHLLWLPRPLVALPSVTL